jgi:hypothetical protein
MGALCFEVVRRKRFKFILGVSGVLLLIVQIGSLSILAPKANNEIFKIDIQTVESIQNLLPANCSVLQLPLLDYPEGGGLEKMEPYDHLRLPLLDGKLNWSFGYTRESKSAKFLAPIAQGDYSKLKKAAFCGISLFKPGDTEKLIETKLLQNKSLKVEFSNPRYIFFRII